MRHVRSVSHGSHNAGGCRFWHTGLAPMTLLTALFCQFRLDASSLAQSYAHEVALWSLGALRGATRIERKPRVRLWKIPPSTTGLHEWGRTAWLCMSVIPAMAAVTGQATV